MAPSISNAMAAYLHALQPSSATITLLAPDRLIGGARVDKEQNPSEKYAPWSKQWS
jgi:hypothetical protein